jgi:hypothetical protein
MISSTYSVPGDGTSSSTPARSGLELAKTFPSKSSGYYWIQSEKMPNPSSLIFNPFCFRTS